MKAVLLPAALFGVILVLPAALVRLPGFDSGEFWRSAIHLAFFLAVFVAIASAGLRREQLLRLFAVLGLEAAVLAAYGLFQAIALPRGWPTGIELLNRLAHTPLRAQGIVWRATATFEEPKWLTIYLLTGIVYAYGCALASWRAGRTGAAAAWFFAIAVVDAAVLATASLGGIPAAAIVTGACIVDFFRTVRARGGRWLLATTGVLLVVAVVVFLQTRSEFARFLANRVASERGETIRAEYAADYPTGYRYAANVRYAASVFRETPLVGIGLGEFGPVGSVRGVELGFPTELTRDGPWVGFGGLPAEVGVLGTAALLWLVFAVFGGRALFRRGIGPEGRDDRVVAGLLVLAVLLKEVYSGFYVHFFTWFPLGLAAALIRSSPGAAPMTTGLASAVE